jgi:MraZ protein
LEPAFFKGEFDLSLDEKSRLMVPAALRKAIHIPTHGEGFVLVPSPERCLWMYPERYFDWRFRRRQAAAGVVDRDLLAWERLMLSMAADVEADKTGRIVVPESSRNRGHLVKDVTVIGVGDHMEVWDRATWRVYSEALLDRTLEVESKAKGALERDPPILRTATIAGFEGGL